MNRTTILGRNIKVTNNLANKMAIALGLTTKEFLELVRKEREKELAKKKHKEEK